MTVDTYGRLESVAAMTSCSPSPLTPTAHSRAIDKAGSKPQRQEEGRRGEAILVVEDEAIIRRCGFAVLRDSGFHVDTAEDGAAAWNAFCMADANEPAYDLLITDNNMPKLTGLELIEKRRAAQIRVTMARTGCWS